MDKVKRGGDGEVDARQVEEVTGVPEGEVATSPKMMAKNRPGFIVWAMGQTQHTNGNAIVRASASCSSRWATSGVSGGGTNIYRGHDNVQGATDIGPNPDSLPGYYGIATGSWKHWAKRVGRRPTSG
jgi:formate dehydrogenase major subunit